MSMAWVLQGKIQAEGSVVQLSGKAAEVRFNKQTPEGRSQPVAPWGTTMKAHGFLKQKAAGESY